MKISIDRQACCAADDQIGPLDMKLDVPDTETLKYLAELVKESGFLQYSSTHSTMYGESSGRVLVSISSEFFGGGTIGYFVGQEKTVKELIPDGLLSFSFRAN